MPKLVNYPKKGNHKGKVRVNVCWYEDAKDEDDIEVLGLYWFWVSVKELRSYNKLSPEINLKAYSKR